MASNYLILPERTEGSYKHPELLISQSVVSPGLDWTNSQRHLKQNNQLFLPPYLFVEMTNHLLSGNQVYDEADKKLTRKTVDGILDNIYKVRDPWRGEFLGARFFQKGKKMMINHLVFDPHGTPENKLEELDSDTLMMDKLPGISLKSWLKTSTPQGLPTKRTKKGNVRYWHPRDGAVVWLFTYSAGFWICCGGGPQDSRPALGVRPVLLAKGESKNFEETHETPKSTLDEKIAKAIKSGKPFTSEGGLVYVPAKGVNLVDKL